MNLREFWIRLTNWEYWPFEVVYFPIFIYWFWLSIKARSLLYFTAANTMMKNGGMLGESKMEIFDQLPIKHLPKTRLISPTDSFNSVKSVAKNAGITFPLIAKPDIGERGTAVAKITSVDELENYHIKAQYPYLIQEFVALPLEAGVFYYRFPEDSKGKISSIVYKEMLTVTGNGRDRLKDLVVNRERAFLQRKVLSQRFCDQWEKVIPAEQKIEMEGIGNHCRGTKFLNGNRFISKEMSAYFDSLCTKLNGFYFGRFDIRTTSWSALEKGEFMIMELNGAGAEPAHVYDPSVSITDAYSSLLHHWKVLYLISRKNHERGIPYLSLRRGWEEYKLVLRNKHLIEQQ